MNIPGYEKLDEIERALVEWQFRLAGDFKTALWGAIKMADDGNLERLRLGFPVEVQGYIKFSREPGYWKAVCDKAAILT